MWTAKQRQYHSVGTRVGGVGFAEDGKLQVVNLLQGFSAMFPTAPLIPVSATGPGASVVIALACLRATFISCLWPRILTQRAPPSLPPHAWTASLRSAAAFFTRSFLSYSSHATLQAPAPAPASANTRIRAWSTPYHHRSIAPPPPPPPPPRYRHHGASERRGAGTAATPRSCTAVKGKPSLPYHTPRRTPSDHSLDLERCHTLAPPQQLPGLQFQDAWRDEAPTSQRRQQRLRSD
jgi:hypothetical protein